MQYFKKLIIFLRSLKCYSSIDELPISIWFEIHKTGDVTALLKKEVYLTKKRARILIDNWDSLYNQYITKFGLSDEFKSSLDDSIRLAQLQADLIITKQPHLKTLIKVEKAKIQMAEDLKERFNKPANLDNILAKMMKYYGVRLRSREIVVSEYYSYINTIIDAGQSRK